ncbi:MAG: SRPBCC family protein [Euryarchaeota archaeon]|nr:SRPBCC family protein [Euryarchaeota archaeon]
MPISVSSSVAISATVYLVWDVFTDIYRWREWNPFVIGVTSISGGNIWAPGGAFVVKYKTDFTPIQATTRSFVQEVLPGRRIVVAGEVLGSQGTMTYDFTPFGPKTIVSATEVFAETESEYRNATISAITQKLLSLLLGGLKGYVEHIGHKNRPRHG